MCWHTEQNQSACRYKDLLIIELTILYALNFYVFYVFFSISTLADVFKNQPFTIIFPLDQIQTYIFSLTTSALPLNAPIATKVVCFSRLLKCLRSLYGKQCGPRSDCSYRSSLFSVRGPRCLLLYLIRQ